MLVGLLLLLVWRLEQLLLSPHVARLWRRLLGLQAPRLNGGCMRCLYRRLMRGVSKENVVEPLGA